LEWVEEAQKESLQPFVFQVLKTGVLCVPSEFSYTSRIRELGIKYCVLRKNTVNITPANSESKTKTDAEISPDHPIIGIK
jgi:hypothetical protein